MQGKTHLVFALFLSTFFIEPLAWFIILFSSVLPDIDSSTSLLGRHIKIIGKVFTHRGFFHSFFFFIPVTVLLYSFSSSLALYFTIGLASHLFLDALTKGGLRLYPFKKKIKGFVKVGSFLEKLFFFFMVFLFLLRLWF